jgi:hypothetical protein
MTKVDTIKDFEQIKKVFETNYSNLPIFMYHDGKQYPVKVININSESFIIKNVGRTDKDNRLLSFTNDGKLYKFTFKFLGSNGNYDILQPITLDIVPASRVLKRVKSELLYLTNISSQNDILKSLVSDNVRINTLLKSFSTKVRDKISVLELFIHERIDVRLKLLNDHDKYIFIPDKANTESVPKECVPYNDYMNQLRNAKGIEKLISEITLPLKFRNIFTFGYISAQNEYQMDEGYLKIVTAISNGIKKEIFSNPIINESKEASFIVDITSEGFSIFHTNFANFGKLFTIGGIIIFELCATAEEKIVCRASIRNIKPTEKQFRIGCQFYTNSEEEIKAIHAFLKKHIPHFEIKQAPDSTPPATPPQEQVKK